MVSTADCTNSSCPLKGKCDDFEPLDADLKLFEQICQFCSCAALDHIKNTTNSTAIGTPESRTNKSDFVFQAKNPSFFNTATRHQQDQNTATLDQAFKKTQFDPAALTFTLVLEANTPEVELGEMVVPPLSNLNHVHHIVLEEGATAIEVQAAVTEAFTGSNGPYHQTPETFKNFRWCFKKSNSTEFRTTTFRTRLTAFILTGAILHCLLVLPTLSQKSLRKSRAVDSGYTNDDPVSEPRLKRGCASKAGDETCEGSESDEEKEGQSGMGGENSETQEKNGVPKPTTEEPSCHGVNSDSNREHGIPVFFCLGVQSNGSGQIQKPFMLHRLFLPPRSNAMHYMKSPDSPVSWWPGQLKGHFQIAAEGDAWGM
ncbi:hypothetical protein K435DRAFT_802710 [Dendrothele bispora CBS 962.96]|uniref:Uncharacterized protein n=1 Tax=Dendrothele bispora (strain CBS 962.96) TaxID=1314807 RepID=A0A4S8LJX2_DENBC|nr:hypothetical protein K435DRAFT_802710 [Dendrothele bispora CBS 962.96]